MFARGLKDAGVFSFSLVMGTLLFGCNSTLKDDYKSWSSYLGDKSVSHYSSLKQIDTNNVQELKIVWEYHSEEAGLIGTSQIQCNSIIIEGVLYGTSPRLKLFALEAATGKERWVFDPFSDTTEKVRINVNRDVAYWKGEDEERIFYSAGSFSYAINSSTGKEIPSFGKNGRIHLYDGLNRNVQKLHVLQLLLVLFIKIF